MISDSLELYDFLLEHAEDKTIVEPAIERLDKFTDKWRGRSFVLFPKEGVDMQELTRAVENAIGTKPPFIEFQSVRHLASLPIHRQGGFYRIAYDGNVSRSLRNCSRHQEMQSRVRSFRRTGRTVEEGSRNLLDLIHVSLGTRTMEPALDAVFGNSLAKLVKHDIVDLWYFRLGYVLIGDFATAETFDPLIALYRKTPVLGRLKERPHTWFFWEA